MDKTPVAFLRSEFDISEHEARKTLGQFGLDGPRHLISIRELSGGQKARVVFALLSQQKAHVLILDEVSRFRVRVRVRVGEPVAISAREESFSPVASHYHARPPARAHTHAR